MFNSLQSICSLKYITDYKRDRIVLINYNLLILTSKQDLKISTGIFGGYRFFKNGRNRLIDFYKFNLCKSKIGEFVEFASVQDGWGQILAEGDNEVLNYFEENNLTDRYFGSVQIPQLLEMQSGT